MHSTIDDDGLDYLEGILREKYELKVTGTLGPDADDDKECIFLNRILRVDKIQK